jgi:hypothetical protein
LPNKYKWFLFILLIWALDNGFAAIYYLFPNETDDQWMFRIQVYTSSLLLVNSFIYFFIANLRRFKPMDNIDKSFALVCGIATVYNSLRLVFGVIYMSGLWYFGFWGLFFIILLVYRIIK